MNFKRTSTVSYKTLSILISFYVSSQKRIMIRMTTRMIAKTSPIKVKIFKLKFGLLKELSLERLSPKGTTSKVKLVLLFYCKSHPNETQDSVLEKLLFLFHENTSSQGISTWLGKYRYRIMASSESIVQPSRVTAKGSPDVEVCCVEERGIFFNSLDFLSAKFDSNR